METENRNVIKNQIENLNVVPEYFRWNKESSWQRLEKKRNRHKLYKIMRYSFAASVVGIIFSISMIILRDNSGHEAPENTFTEYQNRRLLNEMEKRMSGNTIQESYCFVCDGFIPQQQKIKKNQIILYN